MNADWSLFLVPFLIYFAYRIILFLFQCLVYNKFEYGIDIGIMLVLVYILKLVFSPRKTVPTFLYGFFPGLEERYWGILIFKIIIIGVLSLIFLHLRSHPFWNHHIIQVLLVLFGIILSMGLLNELVYVANNWHKMYETNTTYTVLLPLGTNVFWNNTTFALVVAFLIYGVYMHFLTRQLSLVAFFTISFIVTLAFIVVFVILRKLESSLYKGILSFVESIELSKHWLELFKHISAGNDFKLTDFFNIAGPFALIGVLALIITLITKQIAYPNNTKTSDKGGEMGKREGEGEGEGEGVDDDTSVDQEIENNMKRFAIGTYIILFIGFSIAFSMMDFGSMSPTGKMTDQ